MSTDPQKEISRMSITQGPIKVRKILNAIPAFRD
jgi:hypothetical protein